MAVDDAPTVSNAISDISTSEDADNTTINITSVFTDVDNDDSSILDSLVSNSDTSLVAVTISDNTITLDYKENACGNATIVIKGTSNGKSVNETFTVAVACAPDPPAAADSTLNIAEDAQIAYVLEWVDPDISGSLIQKTSSGKSNTGKKRSKVRARKKISRSNINSETLKKGFLNIPAGITLKIQSLPVYGTLKQADSTLITTTPTVVTLSLIHI